MYAKQALREIGLCGGLSLNQRAALDKHGYFVVKGVLQPSLCDSMAAEFDRIHALEGDRGGHEVHVEPGARRVSDIFNKSAVFDPCLEIAPLLYASHYLLGEFKLHGANLREPLPAQGHQDLHADVPKNFDDDWWVSNAIVAFDDIYLDNGPPRVVPGSHQWQPVNVAYVNIHDWRPEPLNEQQKARVPKDLSAPYPGEVHLTCDKGDVVVINSSLWHSGTANTSGARRRVLHLTYTRRDLPQQFVQRAHLTKGLYERMTPAHRFLLDIEQDENADSVARLQAAGRSSGGDWWNPDPHVS